MIPEPYRKYLIGGLVAVGGVAGAIGVEFGELAQGEVVGALDNLYVAASAAFLSIAGAVAKFTKGE